MHHGHFDYFLDMAPMDWNGVFSALFSCALFLLVVGMAAGVFVIVRDIIRGRL